MTVVFVLVGVLVVAGVGWAVLGRVDAGLPDASNDLRPDERGGQPAFDVVLRGYRMDEVDATVAELRDQIHSLKGGRT